MSDTSRPVLEGITLCQGETRINNSIEVPSNTNDINLDNLTKLLAAFHKDPSLVRKYKY